MRIPFIISSLCAAALCVSIIGCSAKEQLGLDKQTPDEFKVVRRAPLELPPNFDLRPPTPGAKRPQEKSMVDEARNTVFGETNSASQDETSQDNMLQDTSSQETIPMESDTANTLLQQAQANAGVTQTPDDIRARVDSELREVDKTKIPVAQKLLGINSKAPATVIDAKQERARIEESLKAGKSIVDDDSVFKEE